MAFNMSCLLYCASLSFSKCQAITVSILYVWKTGMNSRCDTLVFIFTFYSSLNVSLVFLVAACGGPCWWWILMYCKVTLGCVGWLAFSSVFPSWCWVCEWELTCWLLIWRFPFILSINSTGWGIRFYHCFRFCCGAALDCSPLWILPGNLLFIIEGKKFWHISELIQHCILTCIVMSFRVRKEKRGIQRQVRVTSFLLIKLRTFLLLLF